MRIPVKTKEMIEYFPRKGHHGVSIMGRKEGIFDCVIPDYYVEMKYGIHKCVESPYVDISEVNILDDGKVEVVYTLSDGVYDGGILIGEVEVKCTGELFVQQPEDDELDVYGWYTFEISKFDLIK